MEAVGIGDLHLTTYGAGMKIIGGLSKYIPDHDDMVIRTVKNGPLKFAEKNGIKNIFLYGDICEGTVLTYKATIALLDLFSEDFNFHVILGNHDLVSERPDQGHSMQIIKKLKLPNVFIYTKVTDVKIDGARVRFLSWPHCNFAKNGLNVAHIDINGAVENGGRVIKRGVDPTSLCVVGHIHDNQIVKRKAFYSGTLYQTNFGESQQKFFHHISFLDGSWSIKSIPSLCEYKLFKATEDELENIKPVKSNLVYLTTEKNDSCSYKHNVVKIRGLKDDEDWSSIDIKLDDSFEFDIIEFVKSFLSKYDEKTVNRCLRILKELK